MAIPAIVASGQNIAASQMNGIRDEIIDIRTGDTGTLSANTIVAAGSLSNIALRESSSGGHGIRLVSAGSGAFHLQRSTDGFATLSTTPMVFSATRITVYQRMNLQALATYDSDAAAGTGGLGSGDLYWTSTGEMRRKL